MDFQGRNQNFRLPQTPPLQTQRYVEPPDSPLHQIEDGSMGNNANIWPFETIPIEDGRIDESVVIGNSHLRASQGRTESRPLSQRVSGPHSLFSPEDVASPRTRGSDKTLDMGYSQEPVNPYSGHSLRRDEPS